MKITATLTAGAVVAGGSLVAAAAPATAVQYSCLVTAATPVDDTHARWDMDSVGGGNVYHVGYASDPSRGTVMFPVGFDPGPGYVYLGYNPPRDKVEEVDGTIKWRYDIKCEGRVTKTKWSKKKKRYVTKRVWRSRTKTRYTMESVYSWSGWYNSEAEAKAAALAGESSYEPGDIWYG